MILQLRPRQREHGWGEEHGLIVRVRNQETYPPVV